MIIVIIVDMGVKGIVKVLKGSGEYMTENKRFKVYKVIGSFHEWSIEDTVDDKIVFGSIMHKYEADRLCECLNGLADENTELKKQNENLLEKLKYTCDQINYSDKLREMMK